MTSVPIASVEISVDRRSLVVSGASGDQNVPAVVLWRHGTSARARRRRLTDPLALPPSDLHILHAVPVGHYGLNIAFSDGDRGGVFPWALIGELALRPTVDDFIHPAA
jgi:DUF971 family protein